MFDLLFPRRCPVCHGIVVPRGGLICPGCISKLSFVKSPTCKTCGKEVLHPRIEYCFDCTKRPKSFRFGLALLNYDERARASMARIKYKNKREYLDFYGRALALKYGERLERSGAQALIPVPVHPSRRRARGFNQAEELARAISRSLKEERGLELPVRTDVLFRVKKTAPQKELTASERFKNLIQAFEVSEEAADGLTDVILVDDIYTTGSTAEACTRLLLRAGVKNVYVLTICIGQGQ